MILGIFITLILVWPFLITFAIGKKNLIKSIVVTFLLFFLAFNSVHVFKANMTTVKILTTVCIVITIGVLVFLAFKRNSFTKRNLLEAINYSWTLYLIIGVTILIRIFVNHLNADAVAYARNSQLFRKGTWLSSDIPFWYKTPIFSHMAALNAQPVDFFSIFGEISHVVLFAVGVNIIIKEIKNKKTWEVIFMSVAAAISSIFALSYKTSGVNWSAVSIALIYIFACRKKELWLLLAIPFSLSVYSFSPMLTYPVAVILFLWRKKWEMKEFLILIVLSVVSLTFSAMNILDVPYKMFLIIDFLLLVSAIFIILINKKIKNKSIENPIYKIKILKNKDFIQTPRYKKRVIIIATLLFILNEVVMILMVAHILPFPLIIGYKERAMMLTIPIAIFILMLDSLLFGKFSDHFKWLLAVGIVMVVYAALQMHPRVPGYILDRLALPYAMSIGLFTLFRCFEHDLFNKKGAIFRLGAIALICGINLTTFWMGTMPSTIYSPPSSKIEENYKFVTSKERETLLKVLKQDKTSVIYADIAISTVEEVEDKFAFFTDAKRDLFLSEMKTRVKGIDQKYWDDILLYQEKIVWNQKKWTDDKIEKETQGLNLHEPIKIIKKFSFLADAVDLLMYKPDYAKKWVEKYIKDSKNPKRINTFFFRNVNYNKMMKTILTNNSINFKEVPINNSTIIKLI